LRVSQTQFSCLPSGTPECPAVGPTRAPPIPSRVGNPPARQSNRGLILNWTCGHADFAAAAAVLEQNQAEVDAYRGGKQKLLGFFVGQVMKQTRGRADAALVSTLIRKALEE